VAGLLGAAAGWCASVFRIGRAKLLATRPDWGGPQWSPGRSRSQVSLGPIWGSRREATAAARHCEEHQLCAGGVWLWGRASRCAGVTDGFCKGRPPEQSRTAAGRPTVASRGGWALSRRGLWRTRRGPGGNRFREKRAGRRRRKQRRLRERSGVGEWSRFVRDENSSESMVCGQRGPVVASVLWVWVLYGVRDDRSRHAFG